jgi:hypothetical protein
MLNRVAFAAAGLLVMLSALTLAVQRDRISGVWASDGRPLLELKAEGGTVSGTVHFYEGSNRRASAPIESGSFDERTGALRLTGRVTIPDGPILPYLGPARSSLDSNCGTTSTCVSSGRQSMPVSGNRSQMRL